MQHSSTYIALRGLIADFFGIDAEDISPETTAFDVDGWDSIAHTTLILEIERAFGIELDERLAAGAADVAALADVIDQALRAKSNLEG
jgi:acyl carrier protein